MTSSSKLPVSDPPYIPYLLPKIIRILTRISPQPRSLDTRPPRSLAAIESRPGKEIHLGTASLAPTTHPPARLPRRNVNPTLRERHLARLLAPPLRTLQLADRRRGRHRGDLERRRREPHVPALGTVHARRRAQASRRRHACTGHAKWAACAVRIRVDAGPQFAAGPHGVVDRRQCSHEGPDSTRHEPTTSGLCRLVEHCYGWECVPGSSAR